jgi:metal-responsive CopG/Arc/MetJ family transcriptional regulator
MNSGITNGMKTAISVEDALMEQADDAARDLGLSRSGLIAEALREYLLRRRQARVSDRLNQAYANGLRPDERRLVRKLKTKLPTPDRW